ARAEEGLEGALHAIGAHEPLEVATLAAGQDEETVVGALRVRVDGARDQVEEVRLAPGPSLADHRCRILDRQRPAEMPRHAAEEARGQAKIGERESARDRGHRHARLSGAAPITPHSLEAGAAMSR